MSSDAILKKFVWSGESPLSMYHAGNSATYYYFKDANKNVTQLIDNSGNIVAKYEYSPFGKLTSVTDTIDNPFRFSSEYFDTETGLVYYNFRYYSPELGSWLSRDPIEEKGGYNLYAMVGNDTLNKIDLLGLIDSNALRARLREVQLLLSQLWNLHNQYSGGNLSAFVRVFLLFLYLHSLYLSN